MMDSLPTKSDAIGHIDGQPTSKVVDVFGTQENIIVMDSKTIKSGNVAKSDDQYSNLPLYNNNLALLLGVTQRGHENQSYGVENYFMDIVADFDECFWMGFSRSEVSMKGFCLNGLIAE
ncbi:unnamed protein product [Ilex paraguariensis]|uniref:Uncharacterized protein n=1 Tax=Ilex paraguariensis TaxID=185542 RepID=A0ABC8TXL0_9AQUA